MTMMDQWSEIEHLIALNKAHSELFKSPGEAGNRRLYRERHRTEVGASKCSDGRLHLPLMTETPMGIIQPWRNIGGKFDLSWSLYQESVKDWYDYAISRGRRCLKLVTYHFSRGAVERGCRGFNYNRDEAKRFTASLKRQFDEDFGRTVLYTVHCGIETDWESLVLHGEHGSEIDLADITDASDVAIAQMLRELFPSMHGEIIADFTPLVQGNIRHVAQVKAVHRNLATDAEHKEWILAFGRGFDWLHEINKALIIGPFDPNWREVIMVAARLMYENFTVGRSDGNRIVLLSSTFYREETGPEPRLKARKALGLEADALRVIREDVPELLPHLLKLTGVLDINTRRFKALRQGFPQD